LESIIYKEILKAANKNLDDLVPSRWGFQCGSPTQAVAVLATLAAVTHGEGSHTNIQRGGNIVVARVAQNHQMSEYTEMLGNTVTMGPTCGCFRGRRYI
jgi:hypothetical protein